MFKRTFLGKVDYFGLVSDYVISSSSHRTYYGSSVFGVECYHRVGGPANINHHTGFMYWYVRNVKYIHTRTYCEACEFSDEETVMWLLKYGDELPTRIDHL